MTRSSHPNTEIEQALQYAEKNGWRVESGRAHWGLMFCPANEKDLDCRCGAYCITSISGTPRNPGNHARKLKRIVDNCVRNSPGDQEE